MWQCERADSLLFTSSGWSRSRTYLQLLECINEPSNNNLDSMQSMCISFTRFVSLSSYPLQPALTRPRAPNPPQLNHNTHERIPIQSLPYLRDQPQLFARTWPVLQTREIQPWDDKARTLDPNESIIVELTRKRLAEGRICRK